MGILTNSVNNAVPHQNGNGMNGESTATPNGNPNTDPQQSQAHAAAMATARTNSQDEKLHKFLTKLQHTKPTVPPSLTRRILNKQGVGFSDPLVSTVVSCAADQFLATILSQGMVCRDRRLKGEELARKEKREMERVRKRRRAESMKIANKKRKLEKELEDFVKKGQKTPQKQDKKGSNELVKLLETNTFDQIGNTDDLDEEENHYDSSDSALANSEEDIEGVTQIYEEDESDEEDDDDEDDDRDILQMRDLVRPLEAWGISLAGKMGLATEPYIRTPREKANENDEDNVGLEGEADAVDVEEEDDEISTAVEKTPSRKRKAVAKGSPATSKKDGSAATATGKTSSS